MKDIISNIDMGNGFITLICSVLQLTIKKKAPVNYYMSLLYFFLAVLMFYFWAFGNGIIYRFPFLIYSDSVITFAIGPSFYMYILEVLGAGRNLTSSVRHYIPAAAVACFMVIYHFADDSFLNYYTLNHPAFPHYYENSLINIINITGDVSIFIYLILSIKKVYSAMKSDNRKPKSGLATILSFFIAVMACTLLLFSAHYLANDFLIAAGATAIGILVVCYFFFSYRNPEITQAEIRGLKSKKTNSVLKGIDVENIIVRMTQLVENDKVYRDSSITLQSFSNSLNINAYILSIILNEKMGKNFRTYINTYRIQEAKTLLKTMPAMSVLEIAYNVGFNSKSSFNAAFFGETGSSPVEYREKSKNSKY